MLGSQLGSNCPEFQKGNQCCRHVVKAKRFAHHTAYWIYTQNSVGDFPVTGRQEPRRARVHRAEKRNMVVAFSRGHDVKVPRAAGTRKLLRDEKDVLSLEAGSERAQSQLTYTPDG